MAQLNDSPVVLLRKYLMKKLLNHEALFKKIYVSLMLQPRFCLMQEFQNHIFRR